MKSGDEMPYSNDILNLAKERLAERRASAIAAANRKREAAYRRSERLREIDRELGQIGASTALAVLRSGNAEDNLRELSRKSLALQEEYRRELASAGFRESDLEPAFHCAKCQDTGYVEQDNRTVLCDCLTKLMTDVSCESLNALSPLQLSTFESFRLDYYSDRPEANGSVPLNRMSKIFNYCRNYADTFTPSSKGILMRGATGLGKTHLSLAIANELIRCGFSVVYVSAPDILSKLEREHFGYRYDDEADTFGSLIKCDLLILDDLGTEFITPFSTSTVYNIFNSRILLSKPVIMNTNLSPEELVGNYSQRFLSRVMGSCDILEFIGKDVRPRL